LANAPQLPQGCALRRDQRRRQWGTWLEIVKLKYWTIALQPAGESASKKRL